MKACKVVFIVSLILAWSGIALAQDPVKVDSEHYKVLFENATVRVLKIDYAAGAKSPMHQHPDAIVVPLAAAKVRFTMPGKLRHTERLLIRRCPSSSSANSDSSAATICASSMRSKPNPFQVSSSISAISVLAPGSYW